MTSSRPKSMDEVVHQEEAVKTLKNSMETGNVRFLSTLRITKLTY